MKESDKSAEGAAVVGVICALLTPLMPDGTLDKESTRSLLDFVVGGGVNAIMPGGTTGEGPLLDHSDRKVLLEVVAKHLGGRIPIIAHIGCADTAGTLELAQHARDLGVSAVTAIAPYYYTLDEISVENHFGALASAVPDVHVYAYTFPRNAKNEVSPELMRRLANAYPNVRGIKISSSSLHMLREHIVASAGDYNAYCGSDGIMLTALGEGATGQVSGNANVAPGMISGLYRAYINGEPERAADYQKIVDQLRDDTEDGLHPAMYKWLLKELGVIKSARVRLPLRQPSKQEGNKLAHALDRLRAEASA